VREANRRAFARPTRGVLSRRSQLILVFGGQPGRAMDVGSGVIEVQARQSASAGRGSLLSRSWMHVPVIARALLTGVLVLIVGWLPFSLLRGVNLMLSPSIPWFVPLTALHLWLFWQYLQGRGWPRSTAEARRKDLRAPRLSPRTWRWALLAGGTAMASTTALTAVIARL